MEFEALAELDEGGPWEDVIKKVSEFREGLRRASQVSESILLPNLATAEEGQERIEMNVEEVASATRTGLLSILRTQSAYASFLDYWILHSNKSKVLVQQLVPQSSSLRVDLLIQLRTRCLTWETMILLMRSLLGCGKLRHRVILLQ